MAEIYVYKPQLEELLQFLWQGLNYLWYVIGLRSTDLIFPDFIFYVLTPFIISVYAMYVFISGLKIFRFTNWINWIFAVIIVFVSLRFLYPIVFTLSMGILLLTKRWTNSLIKRILFGVGVFAFYWFAVPYLISLARI